MSIRKRRMPAEWEPQSFVQLTWPHKDSDWAPILPEITAVYEAMAREIKKREDLLIVAPENCTAQLSPLASAILPLKTNDTWARDHGFITVEEGADIILLDFKFNGWGEKFPAELDNQINKHLYEHGLVRGTYEDHLDFVLEGGSIESDGKGTIFTTRCCLMAPHRNQPLSQQAVEERLKDYLGAERIVWLNHGSLIGDDTDGHIDTLVRIAPDDTLLYIGADNLHPDLLLMEEELKTLRTIDGHPYRLLRLPMPRPIYSSQFTVHSSQFTGHSSQFTGHSSQFTVHSSQCTVHSSQFTGHSSQFTGHSSQFTGHSSQFTVHSSQCTVHSSQLNNAQPNYELCTMNYELKSRLPATYANYLVINGAVLVPTYNQPDLDQEAMRLIGLAYPDREIIGIDCRAVVEQHGSLHCCTMQFPTGTR